MLGDAELVRTVAAGIRRHRLAPYVLDPVMAATSGDALLTPDAISAIVSELFPLASLVTPNLDEVGLLLGERPHDVPRWKRAARALVTSTGARAALVKGGHLAGDDLVDVLFDGAGVRRYSHRRIATSSTHGTGCTLSAAIAAALALGAPLARRGRAGARVRAQGHRECAGPRLRPWAAESLRLRQRGPRTRGSHDGAKDDPRPADRCFRARQMSFV
jgi:hydroxymethylpyrimidine/phosphomethylpyrimidine kinase